MATPTDKPAGTIEGIEYEEANGSGLITIGKEEAVGTRIFHVDWKDRINFIIALMGGTITNGENTIYVIKKSFPDYPTLLASRVSVRGLGKISCLANGSPAYQYAEIECTYEPNDDEEGDNEDNVLKTEETSSSFETIPFPPMSFKFQGSAREISEGVEAGKRYVVTTHTITETKSPTDKKDIIQNHAGKINSDKYLGVDALKLMYMGARTRRVILASGERPFKIVHTFLEISDTEPSAVGADDATWDKLYDTVEGRWDTIITAKDDGDFDIYGRAEFANSGLVG